MIKLADANVAVLIDFENVGLDAIQYLLDQLSDVGRIIIKRAYGDWSVQRNKQEQLIEQGIEAIHQYRSNRSGKNSSDIRLAIEAIDLFHTSPIDTFVIVSSDSDFVPLVGKLRSSGKTVIGSGRREATSSTLVRSCDRYIFLDDAGKRTPAATQPVRRPRRRTTNEGDGNSGDGNSSDGNSGDGVALALRAYEASINDQGYVAGSKLYQTMRRIDPGFDYRVLGFRTFTQFLESISEVEINRPQNGGDVQVTTKQGRDQASASASTPQAQASPKGQRGGTRRGRPQRPFQRQEPDMNPDQQPAVEQSPTTEDQPSVAESTSDAEQLSVPEQDSEPKTFQPPFIEPGDPGDPIEGQPDTQPVAEVTESEQDEAIEQPVDAEPEQKETEASSTNVTLSTSGLNWEREVDAAWTRRQRNTISGRAAATDAAKALNVDKLSSSQFPSLEKLLKASTLLQLNWRRERNTIVKK